MKNVSFILWKKLYGLFGQSNNMPKDTELVCALANILSKATYSRDITFNQSDKLPLTPSEPQSQQIFLLSLNRQNPVNI